MTPRLARIRIYPVKSLDGVDIQAGTVNGGAGLRGDREWRLVDATGRVADGKRLGERIIGVRSRFDSAGARLALESGGESVEGSLDADAAALERWLSERTGETVHFERNAEKGFPDDTEASGPTLISRATLLAVASWFGLDEEEARRRFRANLEIDGVPAFWEDRLYGPAGEERFFRIGEARLEATHPCARCTVPSRDSRGGEIARSDFAKAFAQKRRETLPEWADGSRFDHFYRLSVNTRIPASEHGKTLAIGAACGQL